MGQDLHLTLASPLLDEWVHTPSSPLSLKGLGDLSFGVHPCLCLTEERILGIQR